ncbi:COG2110 Predicted phosphatase homologous to the C-terminal domain of histone macroH2A1 [Methylophilaceae bacterium]
MIVTSKFGDLIDQIDCDAIVNSANSSMRAGSGVCGAIHKAAGRDLELNTKHLAPLIVPNAVITSAFNLPNKYIIHVSTPKFHIDPNPHELLAKSLYNVFKLAEEFEVETIALPAIGTGIHGFPIDAAIAIYAEVASSFNQSIILKEIRFVFMSYADEIAMSRRIQTRIEI